MDGRLEMMLLPLLLEAVMRGWREGGRSDGLKLNTALARLKMFGRRNILHLMSLVHRMHDYSA